MTDRLAAALADRYRIERELGHGGMATVYLAEDLKHHRRVAIKVLREDVAALVGAQRFLQEIQTTANLQHPHILPLHDSGEADGLLFYVMPFVDGESLRDRIERAGALPVADAVRIGVEIADALDYAHRHGVIHRDIKPANILLHEGRAQLADFGIALSEGSGGHRLTETGVSVGTPGYMSPEQALGDRTVDARTDVYALGAVLYEALTGVPPFSEAHGPGDRGQGDHRERRAAVTTPGGSAGGNRGRGTDGAGEGSSRALSERRCVSGSPPGRRASGQSPPLPMGPAGHRRGAGRRGASRGRHAATNARRKTPPVRGSADTTVQRLVGVGKFWMQRRTQQGCDESTRSFSQATALDSGDVEAWEWLANSSAFCALFGNGDPYTWWVSAKGVAQKTLTLDSGSATGWMVRGMAHLFAEQDWTNALRDLNHAIALDSTRYQPWLYRAWAFEALGQMDSAVATLRHAHRLAPTENIVGARLANILTLAGDTAGAGRAIAEVLHRDPEDLQAHQSLLIDAVEVGDCREARAQLAWFGRHHATAPLPGGTSYRLNGAMAAQAQAMCGEVVYARRYADSLAAVARSGGYVEFSPLGVLYAQLRDTSAMYLALEQGIRQHYWFNMSLAQDPRLRPYAGSPRFQEILRRLHER